MATRSARMISVEMSDLTEDGSTATLTIAWRWEDEPTLVHVQVAEGTAPSDLLTAIASPTADDFDWV